MATESVHGWHAFDWKTVLLCSIFDCSFNSVSWNWFLFDLFLCLCCLDRCQTRHFMFSGKGKPRHRSAQVWHALSRDHTVLSATHTFIHKWNEPYCLYLPSQSWSSFARDHYVTEITVFSCSGCHASLGNWKRSRLWASNSWPLGPRAAALTHYATESPRCPHCLWIFHIVPHAVILTISSDVNVWASVRKGQRCLTGEFFLVRIFYPYRGWCVVQWLMTLVWSAKLINLGFD